MTLLEVVFLILIASAFVFMGTTLSSISSPTSRKEMGIRLPEDSD